MSKLIAVTDEIYSQLSKMKGKRSFSEELRELIEKEQRRKDISALFGSLKGVDTKQWEKEIEEGRKKWYKKRRIDRL